MSAENFDYCFAATLAWERGKVDNPRDPGGRTADGVTQTTYNLWRASKRLPHQDVYKITPAEEREIYETRYWRVSRADTLPSGVDLSIYDIAVNSGPGRAAQWHRECEADDPRETIRRITARRQSFLRGLGTFRVFGRGWMRRVADIYAKSMRLAATAAKSGDPDALVSDVGMELNGLAEEHADQAVAAHKAATGALGLSGIGVLGHIKAAAEAVPWWAYWTVAIVAVALAVYLFHEHLLHVAKVRALQNEVIAHHEDTANGQADQAPADAQGQAGAAGDPAPGAGAHA